MQSGLVRTSWRMATAILAPVVLLSMAALPASAEAKPKPVTAAHLLLANKKLTPGAVIAKATVALACKAGYARTVPAVSTAEAKAVFARYHIGYAKRAQYQLDHLISVGIGGSNAVANLWPEPLAGKYGARAKDAVEAKITTMVCTGRSSLHDAQHAEAGNWSTAVKVLLAKPRQRPPVPAGPSFSDGTHLLGHDVSPGLWAAPGGSGCYWERERDTSGTFDSIITNGFGDTSPIVAIDASDVAFKTSGCGTWRPFAAPGSPATSFGDGTFVVNASIAAGRYSAPGGPDCYWERASDLSGSGASIIANDFGGYTPVVTIDPTDASFQSSGCGTWTAI